MHLVSYGRHVAVHGGDAAAEPESAAEPEPSGRPAHYSVKGSSALNKLHGDSEAEPEAEAEAEAEAEPEPGKRKKAQAKSKQSRHVCLLVCQGTLKVDILKHLIRPLLR